MNLLVTGGAGFIGSNFIRAVLGRPELRTLVNVDCLTYAGHTESLAGVDASPRYIFERGDIRDLADVRRILRERGITHIAHLAAESHVDRSIGAPADFVTTNVLGTFVLLEAFRETKGGCRRFLHVSTDEVYGSLGPEGCFTESSPYAPNSPYSASKASSDLLVRAYHRTYGVDTVITNCSNNYGPYQFPEKLIPVIIQRVLERRQIPVYGDGLQVRDWLHVEDHVEALWQVLLRGRAGESYNIGARNERTNLEIAGGICDVIDELRPDLGGGSRSLIAHVDDRPGHDRRYAVDSTKIERELGWRPVRVFEAALRETVAWYLDNQAWVRAVTRPRAA